MGIKGFTKLFEYNNEINYKDLKNQTIIIDGMVEIYRAALGMKSIGALSDINGKPTAHINTILLGVIFKLKSFNIKQYWVFDKAETKEEYHNPLKELELAKRRQKRKEANEKIKVLKQKENELFSDTDSEDDQLEQAAQENTEKEKAKQEKINKLEKGAFVLQEFYIYDVKFMLNCLNIPWIEAPAGYEAEQICAILTNQKTRHTEPIDHVLSVDADSLLFGAKSLIKRDMRKKKFFKYTLKDILADYKISQSELIKAGIILGCDFAPKTPGIGPKTILAELSKAKLKKLSITDTKVRNLDIIQLTDAQTRAYELFNKTTENIDELLIWNNVEQKEFGDAGKIKELLDWLEIVKSFNRNRIQDQIDKLLNSPAIQKKPTKSAKSTKSAKPKKPAKKEK